MSCVRAQTPADKVEVAARKLYYGSGALNIANLLLRPLAAQTAATAPPGQPPCSSALQVLLGAGVNVDGTHRLGLLSWAFNEVAGRRHDGAPHDVPSSMLSPRVRAGMVGTRHLETRAETLFVHTDHLMAMAAACAGHDCTAPGTCV